MEVPSPARLFAAVAGPALLLLGIVGFFYTASFDGLDDYADGLGGLQVNGWLNLLYLAIGGVGLLVAGVSSRAYALAVGLLFTVLAIVGWGSGWLNVAIAVLGLAAAAGTANSKPRAKPARQRP
ncbi:MAG: DUF4383 domain-containing protein [Solirubrobacterales bacterium]